MKLLTGTSNTELAEKVAKRLGTTLVTGRVGSFADGESLIEFQSKDVQGCHVYIVHSTCRPVNDTLMQLYLMITACKRAGAKSVNVITPYFGYARGDRRFNNMAVPITNSDVSKMLEFAGMDRMGTFDVHSLQIQGAPSHRVVTEDYGASHIGLKYFLDTIEDKSNLVVVSPDAGGIKRAEALQKSFWWHGFSNVGLVYLSKQRSKENQVDSATLIGDVKGKTCLVIDDMIDTGGTLCKSADLIKESGAKDIYAFATHGVFSGKAGDNIAKSAFKKVITTDSMPQ